jgi:hypothetical protein
MHLFYLSNFTHKGKTMPSYLNKKPIDLEIGDIIIGEKDNYSEVVGEVDHSNTIPDYVRIETEHGTLFIEKNEIIEVRVRN